jgi:hypothetical protein
MMWLCLAVSSLGLWIVVPNIASGEWNSWVWGGLTFILGLIGAFVKK